MSTYKPTSPADQHAVPPIPDDDLAIVLADFSARRNSPTLNAYLTGAACLLATPHECNAATAVMRNAWIKALCGYRADALHATAFVMREEFRVRETMHAVDGLSYRTTILNHAGRLPASAEETAND